MTPLHSLTGPWMTTATITAESEHTVDLLTDTGRAFRVYKAGLRVIQGPQGRMTITNKE